MKPQISTDQDYIAAERAASLCCEWHRRKTELHESGKQAARALGKSAAWFSVNVPKWLNGGVAALLPERRELGEARRLFTDLPPWFIPVAKFYYLNTNLNQTRGSVPEAVRRTISLPSCPPSVQRRLIKVCLNNGFVPANGEKLPSCPSDLVGDILARAKAGKPLVPESLARQITVAAPFVKHHRHPTNAGLEYISAAGTQMWLAAEGGAEKIFIRSGDVVECDDATINFPVCVPWTIRGCPCSERYEVKVGRFQWLVAIDVGSRRVLAFTYTARPRSSYRGEDVLALLRAVARQHGLPRVWRLEKGVWKSNLVENSVRTMGCGRISVNSPHAKPFIEGLFNKLWTKLSVWFPEASVGRFQGENEEANKILTACLAGQRDPRKHFPMLADVLSAFYAVIEEHNASIVRSENYGQWIPHERWNADISARPLVALNPQSEWIFAPFVRQWTVNGANVGGKVPIMENVSVPFVFSAPFLLKFHGAKIRAHFDPSEPRCSATIVLAQPWQNHRAREVIGIAPQINSTTEYIRLVFGWGDGADNGRSALRQNAAALRREVRGINGPAMSKISQSEQRDGLGKIEKVSTSIAAATEAAANHETESRSRNTPSDDLENFERDNAHLFI